MHPNPAFRKETETRALDYAAGRGFGIFTAASAGAPAGVLASHAPFLLEGNRVAAHLARSTALCRALREGPMPCRLIVSGPDAYISPDWYGEPDMVPTWNYVAVHLSGEIRLADPDSLRSHLDALSARFEAELSPKSPWTAAKMTPDALARMMRGILPVEMALEGIESTFKLNQNRSTPARAGAADALARGRGPGLETASMAALMRDVPG